MQCGSCGGFFDFPQSKYATKEHYQFCSKCRSSSEDNYSYTCREYEHTEITNYFYISEKDYQE